MMTCWVRGHRESLARIELCTHRDRLHGVGSLIQNGGKYSAYRGLKKGRDDGSEGQY